MIDAKLIFSEAQAITASAASNVLNMGVANANLGDAPLKVRFIVEETFDSTNDTATLTIALQHSATDFGGTAVLVQGAKHAISATTLIKGVYLPEFAIPKEHKQYLRLYYTVGTENFSAGKLTAWIDIA